MFRERRGICRLGDHDSKRMVPDFRPLARSKVFFIGKVLEKLRQTLDLFERQRF